MKVLTTLALLLAASAASAVPLYVNCQNTPSPVVCNSSTGPFNTGNGDTPPVAFGKLNTDISYIFANFPTFTGTITATHCAEWASSGVLEDAGAACGSGGGSGTVNNGTANYLAYYATTGTAVSGTAVLLASQMPGLTGDVTNTAGTLATTVNKVNGAAVPASAAVVASNSSSQLIALTLGNNLQIASSVLQTTQPINAQTGTTYAIATTDAGKLITRANASSCADTLASATTTGYTAGFAFDYQNLGTASCVITPTTSTVNGAASLTLAANTGCTLTSDGTNYQVSACTAVAPTGGTPGGSSGQVQYNNGTTFAGDVGLSYGNGVLTVGNSTNQKITGPASQNLTVQSQQAANIYSYNDATGAASVVLSNGPGSTVAVNGGQGASTSAGGAITVQGGAGGATSGAGGAVTINGGTGSATSGNGGAVNINGGAPTSGDGNSGYVYIETPSVTGSGKNAGDIYLAPGTAGSGTNGSVQLGGTATIYYQGTQNVNASTGTITAHVGGVEAGQYTSGTTGTLTVVVQLVPVGNNGFFCLAHDNTTPADAQTVTYASNQATITGTTVTGDVIQYGCWAY